MIKCLGKGVVVQGQAHWEGVPVLDVSEDAGRFLGAEVPAERQRVTVQDAQGEPEAQSGGVPLEGRRQGARKHTGGDEEGNEEQDFTEVGSPDRRIHDREAPEGDRGRL